MSLYQHWILPRLLHLAMRNRELPAYRARLIPEAKGQIIEIGIGSGLNLPLYSDAVNAIIGVDPSPKLLEMADTTRRRVSVPVELIEGSAEDIPIENRSIDTVVTTWTLCSIPDAQRALLEMRRVLKPSGHLLFVEHGRAPEPQVQWWQDRLTPAWKRLSGGCHLNRAMGELIQNAGFPIERLDTGYMPGPKPMTFMYQGSAGPS